MDRNHALRVELCRCLKQDIPAVEAIIAALLPILETWWTDAIADALYRGNLLLGSEEILSAPLSDFDRLSGRMPDGRTREEVEALLVAAIMQRIEGPIEALPARLAAKVEDARDSLLADALLALGLSLTSEQLATVEGRLGPLRPAAVADLETLLRGRVTVRRREVEAAVRRVVRSRTAPPRSLSVPGAATGSLSLKEELEQLLGASSPRQWLAFVADQWSYRWWNIWSFVGARADGFSLFRLENNPPFGPDKRTTPFCREVHGRLLDTAKVEERIRNHVRAALRGDVGPVMENWPLLPSSVANSEGARAMQAWPRVGLPPYHARCRTVVTPVRLSR